jgi:hypothetical protein
MVIELLHYHDAMNKNILIVEQPNNHLEYFVPLVQWCITGNKTKQSNRRHKNRIAQGRKHHRP